MLTMNAPLLMSYEVYASPCITLGDSEEGGSNRFGFEFFFQGYMGAFFWLRTDED